MLSFLCNRCCVDVATDDFQWFKTVKWNRNVNCLQRGCWSDFCSYFYTCLVFFLLVGTNSTRCYPTGLRTGYLPFCPSTERFFYAILFAHFRIYCIYTKEICLYQRKMFRLEETLEIRYFNVKEASKGKNIEIEREKKTLKSSNFITTMQ